MQHAEAHEPLAVLEGAGDQQVAHALARIEDRLAQGDKRFDAMDEHVKECTAEKAKLLLELAKMQGQMGVIRNLMVALVALVGSGIVAVAILMG